MSSPASNDPSGHDRLELDGLTRQERYKLLTGSVIPRPIAFVTTLNADGGINAAPFSQFIIIAADPGLLGFSIGPGPARRAKDTLVNVRRTGEFVINTVPEELAVAVQMCADNEVPGENELDLAGLTTVPSEKVAPPRVAQTLIQFECGLERIVEFGNAQLAGCRTHRSDARAPRPGRQLPRGRSCLSHAGAHRRPQLLPGAGAHRRLTVGRLPHGSPIAIVWTSASQGLPSCGVPAKKRDRRMYENHTAMSM